MRSSLTSQTHYMSWLFCPPLFCSLVCQDPIRHPMQHLNQHPISQTLHKISWKAEWKCHNLRYICIILSSNRIMMEIQYVMNPSLQICQLLILWSRSISQLYPLVFATMFNFIAEILKYLAAESNVFSTTIRPAWLQHPQQRGDKCIQKFLKIPLKQGRGGMLAQLRLKTWNLHLQSFLPPLQCK